MEELERLRICQIEGKLQNSLARSPLDQIQAHCRKDHLGSNPFDQRKNVSTYCKTYSPAKEAPNFNHPSYEKGLQAFRKNENSTSALSVLPVIGGHSHYQDSYHGNSVQKLVKGKENKSYFLKMDWALEPSSHYQKTYLEKDGTPYNKQNKERIDNNNLSVSGAQQVRKRQSNYRTEFQPYHIVKQAQISIGNKDHLASKQQSQGKLGISEYQRRYDSVIELAKPKDYVRSIYRKEPCLGRKLK